MPNFARRPSEHRVDLRKALIPRLSPPTAQQLIKSLHRTGGAPLLKAAAAMVPPPTTAPAVATPPAAPPLPKLDPANGITEAVLERLQDERTVAAVREAQKQPGAVVFLGGRA